MKKMCVFDMVLCKNDFAVMKVTFTTCVWTKTSKRGLSARHQLAWKHQYWANLHPQASFAPSVKSYTKDAQFINTKDVPFTQKMHCLYKRCTIYTKDVLFLCSIWAPQSAAMFHLSSKEQKKAFGIWYSSHTFQPCSWHHWCRLLGTKWQHS